MASLPKTDLSSSVFPGVALSLDRVGVRQNVDLAFLPPGLSDRPRLLEKEHFII